MLATHRAGAALLVATAGLVVEVLLAQPWSGAGRAGGTVLDAEGRPVEGARVTLRLDAEPAHGPPSMLTDAQGRWRLSRIAPGRWRVSIEARGHINSYGRVLVPDSEAVERVDVRLRSLDEVSPSSSEGSPDIVADWIDRGDSLLRDGRYAEARAEYRKALGDLPPGARPAVLQAIARTYELEGKADYSLDRQESVGAAVPPAVPEWPVRPLLPAEPHRPGRFRTAFVERAPEGALDEYALRHAVDASRIAASDPAGGGYRLADESFEVFVPESYTPGVVHGLFVWISPGPFGGTERAEVQRVLAERRLIWIGANASGNGRPRWVRVGLALDAVHNMMRLYDIDPRRVWVGGYSGGGRVASGIAIGWPEVFHGGMFLFGCDFYRDLPVPDRPGAVWPAAFAPPPSARRKLARSRPLVIVSGTRDFNRAGSRAVHDALRADGFARAALLEIPGADHETPVPAERLREALAALEP